MPTRPVPPPVGYKRTSGIVQPSCSASSSPIVFLPSRRYGSLSVERSNQPICGATFATTLPAVAIEPSMVKTLAPVIAASAIAARGVHGGGAAGVARRGDHEAGRAACSGKRNCHAEAASLEQAGGVLALVLAPDVAEPEMRGEPAQGQQRRTPLA